MVTTNNKITTSFAGLKLANPIIAASCSLTGTATANAALAAAGIGAIVLKSLFEEDIIRESAALSLDAAHCEAAAYMEAYMGCEALGQYISLIKESKAACGNTPIIASINCANAGQWVDYARAIEAAGADALEINIMTLGTDAMASDGELENRHIAIAKQVSAAAELPIIMKLGAQMSNHTSLISRLEACGISGFVLFNRAYPLDIDIEKMEYTHGAILSGSGDISTPLRHIAIASAASPKASLALSGGVQGGKDIVKAILAGAAVVEVSSALYRAENRTEWVAEAIECLSAWQAAHGYESIEQMRGVMNQKNDAHSDSVTRTQFLKHFGTFKL